MPRRRPAALGPLLDLSSSMPDRSPKLQQLLEKARALPKTPGVYLMKDGKGRVI
jgi:hypothetical protein